MNRIYPNWQQISNLKTPLTDGELYLSKFLDETLPEEWEIFIQPYFNGDRPDLVILHPFYGVMIYEIKDWNLSLYSKNETGVHVITKEGKQKIGDPISQLKRYRTNLISYLPKIAEEIDKNNKNLSTMKLGFYFHNATTQEARNFIQNKDYECIGRDFLKRDRLGDIIPFLKYQSNPYMSESWYKEIRFWLAPPFHSIEQGQKIILSPEQKKHISPAPQQHQRLKGVAGSGKTLVIAQRAAYHAAQGQKVLIITFNITLWHYIKDAVSRARENFDWSAITFKHFHGFCRDYLLENNVDLEEILYDDDIEISDNALFNKIIPTLVIENYIAGKNKKNRTYDVILIDEAQDYHQSYYDALCLFLSKNDELLLVADEKQNIYERDLTWIDGRMTGTKFRGRWRELKQSYRVPTNNLSLINKFVKIFLPNIGSELEPVSHQEELFHPHFIWRNVNKTSLPIDLILKIFKFLTRANNIHPSDIVILVHTHAEGEELVKFFRQENYDVNHVFSSGSKSHYSNKKSFHMGDSRIKICTIHSFKGWEIKNVIMLTPKEYKNDITNKLMYIAFTRSRENLVILNRIDEYNHFGNECSSKWE